MVNKEITTEKIDIPKGVTVSVLENSIVKASGQKGECQKKLLSPFIEITVENNEVVVKSKRSSQREIKILYSFVAHIKNLIKGVTQGFTYTLKICSGHFPMTVTVKGTEFSVKNLFGEAVPRVMKIKDGVKVSIVQDKIEVSGTNLEIVSQVSADIEGLVRRVKYDRRVFQDGIYIIDKSGKEI
jgi:large subunit ribosomal protein L6